MQTTFLPRAVFGRLDTPVVPSDETYDHATSYFIGGDLADVLRLFHNSEPTDEVVLTQIGIEWSTDHTTDLSCSLLLLVGGRQVWSSDLGVTHGHLVPDDLALPTFIDEVRSTVRILSESGMFEASDPELGVRVGHTR